MLKDKSRFFIPLQKMTVLLIFFILLPLNAQRKKKDTVFVYEKVIVHDTVYLEKALKIQPKGLSLNLPEIMPASSQEFKFTEIKDKTEGIVIPVSGKMEFGFEAGVGMKRSSWAIDPSGKKTQSGFNVGIWASKPIFNRFSLMLSAHMYYWNSTFDLDGTREDTWLNGYYFTEDHQPLLFQRFNNKHLEYAAQLKILYEWKNIRPFAGFLVNRNSYKMQFLVPENNVLNKPDDFKTNQINFGFTLGLQYRIMRKFLISLEYQEYKMKNISLKNSSFNFDIFKTNNTFAERKINLGISYSVSGW